MAHAAQHQACWCATCRPVSFGDMRMVLCPVCGNKRCPRASNHTYVCTGSNEVGQVGSAYIEQPKPHRVINGAIMTKDELEAIATREAHCKPFGSAVTLSVGERDALVAMARRYLVLRDASISDGGPIPMTYECAEDGDSFWWPMLGDALDKELDANMEQEQA